MCRFLIEIRRLLMSKNLATTRFVDHFLYFSQLLNCRLITLVTPPRLGGMLIPHPLFVPPTRLLKESRRGRKQYFANLTWKFPLLLLLIGILFVTKTPLITAACHPIGETLINCAWDSPERPHDPFHWPSGNVKHVCGLGKPRLELFVWLVGTCRGGVGDYDFPLWQQHERH